MAAAVEFSQVNYSAGGRTVLRDFNLRVETGETLVLLGRSGSGKTTALRLVNGLLLPESGHVLVEGKSTSDCDLVQLRRRIGYVIQEGGLFPHFTVRENVGLVPGLENWEPDRISSRVDALLSQVGLPAAEYAGRYPAQLSGGQRQRTGVARALANDPPILLFDEPFAAVDPVMRNELQRQFVELRDALRKTALFVTHDTREALIVGSRIGLLADGQLVFLGTGEEFRASGHPEVRAFLETIATPATQ